MRIIRDPNNPVAGRILCIDWGIKRCNNWGCKENPSIIVTGLIHPIKGEIGPIGLCEGCFQLGNVPQGYTFVFGFGNPENETEENKEKENVI